MTFAYKDVILIWALSIICISMEDTVILRLGIEWGWEVCSPLHTSGNYNLYPCKEPNKKACIHNSYLLVHTCNQTQSLCIQAESVQQTKHGGVACVEPVQVGPGSRMRARLIWERNQSRPRPRYVIQLVASGLACDWAHGSDNKHCQCLPQARSPTNRASGGLFCRSHPSCSTADSTQVT